MATSVAKIFYEDVEVGGEIPAVVNPPLIQNMSVRYSGASGDFNPLHTDHEFSEKVGIGKPIAHGMHIMGLVGHMISDYLGGPAPLRRFGVRFQSMTRHGDIITTKGTIIKKFEQDGEYFIEGEVWAQDDNGDKKAAGTFLAAVPSKG
jgi:acyl dehydratase